MSTPTPYRTPAEPVPEDPSFEMTREFIERKLRPVNVPDANGPYFTTPAHTRWDTWQVYAFIGLQAVDAINNLAAAIRERK